MFDFGLKQNAWIIKGIFFFFPFFCVDKYVYGLSVLLNAQLHFDNFLRVSCCIFLVLEGILLFSMLHFLCVSIF